MSKKKSEKQSKPWYKQWWGILLIIFVIIPAALAVISPAKQESNNGTQQTSQPPSIHYIDPIKEITNTKTVGTRYIVVSGYLLNDTNEEGVADCNVEFYDHELNWAGGKGLGGRTLKTGERYDFTVQVEVDHTGLVSKQGINCEQL